MAIKKAKAFPNLTMENLIKLLNNTKSGDQTRPFMCECYYEADEGEYGAIVSTDSHRLVVWKLTEFQLHTLTSSSDKPSSGYVSIDAKRMAMYPLKQEGFQYPQWKKAIPTSSELSLIPFKILPDALTSIVVWAGMTGYTVNPAYMVDVPIVADSKIRAISGEYKNKRAFTIEVCNDTLGEVLVVIMPVHVEDYDD